MLDRSSGELGCGIGSQGWLLFESKVLHVFSCTEFSFAVRHVGFERVVCRLSDDAVLSLVCWITESKGQVALKYAYD